MHEWNKHSIEKLLSTSFNLLLWGRAAFTWDFGGKYTETRLSMKKAYLNNSEQPTLLAGLKRIYNILLIQVST